MGLKPGPFNSVRFFYLAEEFARGIAVDTLNPMSWDALCLNLPGSLDYAPHLPNVMKWSTHVNRIAEV